MRVLLFLIFAAPSAFGCLCPGLPTMARSTSDADAIFEGTVIAKRVVLDRAWWDDSYIPATEYDFAVVNVWKGGVARRVRLAGGRGGCAREFAPDRRYVVFAVRRTIGGALTDLDCGVTHVAKTPRESLTYMGPPIMTYGEQRVRSLPPEWREAMYRQRAYVIAGAALLANLAANGAQTIGRVDSAPLGVLIAGMLTVLLPLIGAATQFDLPRRAVALLLLAVILAWTTFSTSGRLLIAHPRDRSQLIAPLTYVVPN